VIECKTPEGTLKRGRTLLSPKFPLLIKREFKGKKNEKGL
jgi:hypothetical protein